MEKIIVFGTGSYFLERKKRLEKFYEIIYCIDNAVLNQEYRTDIGLIVFNPLKIKESGNERILCMSKDAEAMRKQLQMLDVSEERIVYGEQLLGYLIQDMPMSEYEEGLQVFRELPLNPVDRLFGAMHGTPVDRYYINKFMEEKRNCIKNVVMEIGSLRYTKQYGSDLQATYVMHVNGWGSNTIKGNLETGEGIEEGMVDCIICTQTMQYTFDLKAVARNIYKALKPGGHALVSLPGIKSISVLDNDNWSDLWSFTKYSTYSLFDPFFSLCSIRTYGNAKVTMGYLYGIPAEAFTEEELEYMDSQFQFLIAADLVK